MRKTRSFLTILSIFIGIATIFIFVSFGLGLYNYVDDLSTGSSANKFTVSGKGMGAPGTSDVKLTDSDLTTVKRTVGVIDVIGVYMSPGEVVQDKTRKYVFVMGYDPKSNIMSETMGINITKGRGLTKGDDNSVVLGYGYTVANKIFPKPVELNSNIEINGEKLRVVGFYGEIGNPSDDANIYMTEKGFLKLFPETDSYGILFGSADIKIVEPTVERLIKNLRRDRGEEKGKETLSVASFVSQLEAFSTALNMVIFFIIMIAFISVVISAINTANTMVTSVLERIKEIGIIKSIGAKNSEIFNIFLFESSFLGLVGGLVGVFLGWLLSSIGGATLKAVGFGFLQPYFSWSLFLGCIAFAVIVGAISGVAPAINASQRRPVDALRDD